jgi:hypothetical protein
VLDVMLEHARMLADWWGEPPAMRAFRKHTTWYTKGFFGSAALRQKLMHVATLTELASTVATLDRSERFPPSAMRVPRGKSSGTQVVSLPDGYLNDIDDATPPAASAEDAFSGG